MDLYFALPAASQSTPQLLPLALYFAFVLRPNTRVLRAEQEEGMVRPERVELPTYWFVASRSIQLSYGRTAWFQAKP